MIILFMLTFTIGMAAGVALCSFVLTIKDSEIYMDISPGSSKEPKCAFTICQNKAAKGSHFCELCEIESK